MIHSVPVEDIFIEPMRQRKTISPEEIVKLADSIGEYGLIHPVVLRQEGKRYALVAGERRIKAIKYIWEFGKEVRCGESTFPEGHIPATYWGEIDPLVAYGMELEENIRRVDLPWQERAAATAKLMEFRTNIARRDGEAPPTIEEIAVEVHGTSDVAREATRQDILVASHLDDPDIKDAKTVKDAFKTLKRKEELAQSAELARKIGLTFSASMHTLKRGDCFDLMSEMDKESFDVILTDPPYGIDADSFGDSGGRAGPGSDGSHFYADSWTIWNNLARRLAAEAFRLAKPQAHFYSFCDIDNFILFKQFMLEANWEVFRTPLVWVNPTANRVPWVESGPMRKYQVILYAKKGNRPVSQIYPDILTYPSDKNLNHHAQKPVGVYLDLLRRSIRPGDTVLDPFAGTGTVIPAAHQLKCKATAIEMDEAAYGIAVSRLKELK